MKKINKVLTGIVLAGCALSANAQSTKNVFAERTELVQSHSVSNALPISWYVGAVDVSEFKDLVDRFLSFSNYLTHKLDRLVVLDTLTTDQKAGVEALKGKYEIVYTSSLVASQLAEMGWNPVLARSEDVNLVVLALASNKKINSKNDFKNTVITTTNGSSIARTVGYSLIKDGLIDNAPLKENRNFKPRPVGQEQLVDILKNKQTDGIIVRDVVAKKLMNTNPQQYKIVYTAPPVLGHVVLTSPNFDYSKVANLKEALKGLDNLSSNDPVLRAIDGLKPDTVNVFKEIKAEELKAARDLVKMNDEFKISQP